MPRKLYPCTFCKGNCDRTCSSVECFTCKGWIHRRCVPMSTDKLEAWAEDGLQFVCRVCALDDGQFSSQKALDRLHTAASSGDPAALRDAARSEMMLLQTYDVQPPKEVDNIQCSLSDEVDEIAVQVLNKFHPVINTTHVPISILGDGNCLFRAVSMALYGSDEHHTYIRLRTALEIINNQTHDDYEHEHYVDHFNDNRLLFDTYSQLVTEVTKVGSFSCLLVVSAISAAMDCPIQSYCPPTKVAYFLSDPLSREVRGRGVTNRKKSNFTLMWTTTHVPSKEAEFRPNHFVLLKEKTNKVTRIDLTQEDTSSCNEQMGACGDWDVGGSDGLASSIDGVGGGSDEVGLASSSSDGVEGLDDVGLPSSSSDLGVMGEDVGLASSASSDGVEGLDDLSNDDVGLPSSSSDLGVMGEDHREEGGRDDGRLPLENNKFMEAGELMKIIMDSKEPIEKIPIGEKNNVFFKVKNDENIQRRAAGKISQFWDDRGAWKGGSTSKTVYLKEDDNLKLVIYKNNMYNIKKKKNGVVSLVPLDPQPSTDNVVTLYRYYAKHGSGQQYERRVSWLSGGTNAIYEYKGVCPTLQPNCYVRMYPKEMTKLKEKVKVQKPSEIYSAGDFFEGPSNRKQIYNAKARSKVGEERLHSANFADEIAAVEELQHSLPFVRLIVREAKKVPSIILYSEQQIADIKRFCCPPLSGQSTILGMDKTYNLGKLYVTATCYKCLSVHRQSTQDYPVFCGPLFLHGNSDKDTFFILLQHLQGKLSSTGLCPDRVRCLAVMRKKPCGKPCYWPFHSHQDLCVQST